MLEDTGMVSKVIKENKKAEGVVTIERKKGDTPAYRLNIKSIKRLEGGLLIDRIKVVRR